MTIAAHILSFHQPTAHLYECLIHLAKQKTEVQIIFFAPAIQPGNLPKNCSVKIISPAIKSSILLHYWYNYKLPALLKEANADVFISENGILSFRTGVKQIMLLPELFTDTKINYASFKNYRKRFFKYFLKKAAVVLTANPVIQQQLETQFRHITKCQTIFFGIDDCYKPLSIEEQEDVKKMYSNERDFFTAYISPGNQQEIMQLFKAFSIFKKWHKSAMKLVLLLQQVTVKEAIPNINSYRFKEDIILLNTNKNNDTANILASSFACIYLPEKIMASNIGIQAQKCGTPLITYKNSSTSAAFGDAALYAQHGENGLAEQLSELYKSDILKNNIIQKGIEHSRVYSWQNASGLLWEAIQ